MCGAGAPPRDPATLVESFQIVLQQRDATVDSLARLLQGAPVARPLPGECPPHFGSDPLPRSLIR